MPAAAPSREALRTLRQRGSLVLGWLAVVGGYGMALWSLVSGEPSLGFIGGAALVGSLGVVLFVKPSLTISLHGVHVRNPLRRTVIPWVRLQDVGTRWNLELYFQGATGADGERPDRHVTSWAIATHVQRQRGGGLLGALSPRRLEQVTQREAEPAASRGTTVGSAAQSVEVALQEWREMVADRRAEVSTEGEVERTWEGVDLLAVLLPLLLIAVAVVL
ncbi:PH domain-containing protein [Lapillicoccus jejuensis]|uniref:PH (Pleckstrin Homology) domain-containing protein n=1 Tax=Lapillicoccus jejuensis TaxID=402171 RepID=A0A542E2A3_9MICO|nr:PH domain-containing protein [Lapillicoccus jejuensis]TQJ09445.1 PH (Pleckstrin Homology) domain-containing protein [Lapillicoccus jejuensis]